MNNGATNDDTPSLAEAMAEVRRLRARVVALEAEIATMRGTIAQPQPDDEPATIIHNVPPNAPR